MKYFKADSKIQLIHSESIKAMRDLPDQSVDLIIADPPYRLGIPERNGVNQLMIEMNMKQPIEEWDSFSLDEYISFTTEWLTQAMRVLKPTGSIFIFGSYHNAGLVNYVMQSQSVMIINEIAWFKRNAVPHLAKRRLTASHETIIWGAHGKKYLFNYEQMKEYPDDIIHRQSKQMRSVWDIATNPHEDVGHPTQKPVAIYKRIIDMASLEGHTVLDPFAGSGTLAIAASSMNRHAIMIEREARYIGIIQNRMASAGISQEVSYSVSVMRRSGEVVSIPANDYAQANRILTREERKGHRWARIDHG